MSETNAPLKLALQAQTCINRYGLADFTKGCALYYFVINWGIENVVYRARLLSLFCLVSLRFMNKYLANFDFATKQFL
jgi:hypothetical protein